MNFDQNSESITSKILSLVTYNFWLKVLSIGFAIVIFLIVRADQVREFSKIGKLIIQTTPQIMVIGPKERSFELTIRLPNAIFYRQPLDSDLTSYLDLTREKAGKLRIRLSRDYFPDLDKRYGVIIPDPWMEIELDEVVSKKIKINALLQGMPSEGLSIEKVVVEPDEILVTGPKKELAKLESIPTSPIKIDAITKNFITQTTLNIEESSLINIESNKKIVTVQVLLAPQNVTKLFKAVPVEVARNANVKVSPTHIDVELSARQNVINSIKIGDVRAFLDVSVMSPGEHERKVHLKIPPNSSLVRIVPDTVSVQVFEQN